MMCKFRLLLYFCLLCCSGVVAAQGTDSIPYTKAPADTSYVYLLNADLIRFEEWINPDAQRLIGGLYAVIIDIVSHILVAADSYGLSVLEVDLYALCFGTCCHVFPVKIEPVLRGELRLIGE